MTNNERKECISALRQLLAMCDFVDQYGDCIDADPYFDAVETAIESLNETGWIPVSKRLPSEEERKEWIDNNLDGIGYLYPCLVTRYSSINPDRTKNNPYVAKHYFDGEDFVNCGEEVCSEYILAWMPLPMPYREDREEYELATEQMEHDAMYEPTYNSEDGSM